MAFVTCVTNICFKRRQPSAYNRDILFNDLIKTFLLTSETLVGTRPATAFIRYQLSRPLWKAALLAHAKPYPFSDPSTVLCFDIYGFLLYITYVDSIHSYQGRYIWNYTSVSFFVCVINDTYSDINENSTDNFLKLFYKHDFMETIQYHPKNLF